MYIFVLCFDFVIQECTSMSAYLISQICLLNSEGLQPINLNVNKVSVISDMFFNKMLEKKAEILKRKQLYFGFFSS